MKDKKTEPKECGHEETYPVDLFPATDWSEPYLIVQCSSCSGMFPVGGWEFDADTGGTVSK